MIGPCGFFIDSYKFIETGSRRRGMSTSVDDAVAIDVTIDDRELCVRIKDGRTISVPLDWFPRLAAATAAERADWRLIGEGEGIHWRGLDEDISIPALLRGR
jgi:hypothetical protein